MKGTVALLLIVISMVAAEAPRPRVQLARQINTPQQQQQQPYMPSGWRPNGQQFNLPLKYGPPPTLATEQPEPEQTTTDVPTTTTESSFQQQKAVRGELRENPDDVEVLPEQPQQQQQPQQPVQPQQQFFVLLPSTPTQNLLYTTTPQQAQKLIVAPQQQQQQQQFVTPARLQLTTVFTPFSASYVQILQ